MKKIFFLILVPTLICAQVIPRPKPKDVKDFRGLKFGSSIEQSKRHFRDKELEYKKLSTYNLEQLTYTESMFDKIGEITLLYTEKKLSKVLIQFENDSEDEFPSAFLGAQFTLIAKYGEPDSSNEKTSIYEFDFPSLTIGLYIDKKAKTINIVYESKYFLDWKKKQENINKI